MRVLLAVLFAALEAHGRRSDAPSCWSYDTPDARFRVEVVARDLTIPVSIAFLPDARHALVAERPLGQLDIVDLRTGTRTMVSGVPAVDGQVDGGLLDVLVHPSFARTGRLYLAYAARGDNGNALVVEQAVLRGSALTERRRIFVARPALPNDGEFGTRLVLSGGYLYIGVGQRDTPGMAQRLDSHLGKIVRLDADGGVPRDNPFVGRPDALPEIWTLGHRNMHGLAIEPETGELWEHEHGPRGGDEINVIRRGANYGWPVITYGIEYSGEPVGEGLTRRAGMEQPVHHYVPSIAPSGMAFYSGRAVAAWRGNLFLGSMAYRHLNRLVLAHGRVVREERLLVDRGWRVRDVREGLDGMLYIAVDSGYLLRIRPRPRMAHDDECARGHRMDDPWRRMSTATLPLASAHAAFDFGRRVLVAVGLAPDAHEAAWEWDGADWRPTHGTVPTPRDGHAMSDDPAGGVLLFGGRSTDGHALADTWRERDGVWTKLETVGPPPRRGASMTSDFDHRRLFLFGGDTGRGASQPSADLWRWSDDHWSRVTESGPSARIDAALAYEPATRALLLFGGRDATGRALGDTWRWDDTGWHRLDAHGPSARWGAHLVYMVSSNALRLIGGEDTRGRTSKTWEWRDERWTRVPLGVPDGELVIASADPPRARVVLVLRSTGTAMTYVGVR